MEQILEKRPHLTHCIIAAVILLGAFYIIKEIVDDRQIKRDLEADPYYQSLYRAADAINMVRGHSFAELNHEERHKVVMKCAEAYALATLQSSQPLDDDPSFRRYLFGLRIVARTHYLSENVKQVNQAIDMIRDYLWSLYDGYDYNY